MPEDHFETFFATITDEAFWDSSHARDLLFTLFSRWNTLGVDTRNKVTRRILKGPSRDHEEDEKSFEETGARSTLHRITWLSRKGCEFNIDLEVETEKLRLLAPTWKPEHADKAAESLEGRSSFVGTDTEHSALLMEPLISTLSRAVELRGRKGQSFVEYDPFAGLSAARPVRAFAVLRFAAKKKNFPKWAWSTFLNSETRKRDKPKFIALIADQLACYPDEVIAIMLEPIAEWLLWVSRILSTNYPASFERVVRRLIQILELEPENSTSGIHWGSKELDWATEAINAPTGNVARSPMVLRTAAGFLQIG